jgi:protein-L-isoaspartate O-methyltransferase
MIKSLKRKINRNSLYINASFAVQRAKKKLNPERGFHIDKIDKIMAAKGLFGISTFIETGTYLGVTTNYVQSFFKKVYTIELSKLLADEATQYFASKNHVKVLQGDSGLMLKILLKITQKRNSSGWTLTIRLGSQLRVLSLGIHQFLRK